jgi:hypothetical protein
MLKKNKNIEKFILIYYKIKEIILKNIMYHKYEHVRNENRNCQTLRPPLVYYHWYNQSNLCGHLWKT